MLPPTSSPALKVQGLRHDFDGVPALNDVAFSVPEGSILCVFGPDGAGKTTLFRLLAGVLTPKLGSVQIQGIDMADDPAAARRNLGYLAEGAHIYADLTVADNVRFFYEIHGRAGGKAGTDIDELLAFVGLLEKKHALGGELSGGQRQRLALANVLANKPRILVMDEPTTGLDPVARRELWRAFAELKSDGVTLVVGTPYMEEVERCDQLVVLSAGRVTASGVPGELVGDYSEKVVEVEAAARLGREARRRLASLETVREVYVVGRTLRCILTVRAETALTEIRKVLEVELGKTEDLRVAPAPARLEDALITLFEEGRP